jgi:hypothetical protein
VDTAFVFDRNSTVAASLIAMAVEHSPNSSGPHFPIAHKKGRFCIKTAFAK